MKLGLIGCGLIGGTFAYALKERAGIKKVLGFDTNNDHLTLALAQKFIDEKVSDIFNLQDCDVILIAIPVTATAHVLPKLLDIIAEHTVVFDVGSTKAEILDAINNHPKRKQFVATHPMWGTEFSGPMAAQTNAGLKDKTVVICDKEQSSKTALELIEKLYTNLGMKILYMNAQEHDLHTAYISHISHISSYALSLTVLEKEKEEDKIFQLASGGFESTVRLAKSNPEMWVPIFKQNRSNVLDVMNELIHQLKQMKKMIEMEQYDALKALFEHANEIKRILK